MTTENIFTERQHFRQIWVWALLIGINGLFVYGLVKQVYFGQTFGDNPASNEVLIALTVMTFLISIGFIFIRLDTAIDKDGVHYRYFPFQRTMKNISWDRISKSYVRQYSPIGEYGGWGLRIGLFGKGQAFNVSGNKGLQLVYDNGKKFLLGTQRPDDIKNILQQLGRLTDDSN
jgi:hypothetical protein